MRIREKVKRSVARWGGVAMLCCAIVAASMAEHLPLFAG